MIVQGWVPELHSNLILLRTTWEVGLWAMRYMRGNENIYCVVKFAIQYLLWPKLSHTQENIVCAVIVMYWETLMYCW